uniref:Uncharacterized protein orf513 n=1 Tax=Bigelowiella natans TaxID=227086 RepID=E9NZV5_BIGNA|nr:hypothetical protein [Bigelowiella natans]
MRLVKNFLLNVLNEHLIDYPTPSLISAYIGKLSIQTVLIIEWWFYFINNKGLTLDFFTGCKRHRSSVLGKWPNFVFSLDLLSGGEVNSHTLVNLLFCISTVLLLFNLFRDYQFHTKGGLSVLKQSTVFCLRICKEFLITEGYYFTTCIVLSYSVATWLAFPGQHFWFSFIGFYFTLIGLKWYVFDLIAYMYLGLIVTDHPIFIFIGMRLKWVCKYAEFNFITSVASLLLANLLFFDFSLARLGWDMVLFWGVCWVFPFFWGRIFMASIYPILFLCPMSFPLLLCQCFSALYRNNVSLKAFLCLCLVTCLSVYEFIDLRWVCYVKALFCIIIFIYHSIYSIMSLHIPSNEQKAVQPAISQLFLIPELFDFDTHPRIPIPLTREAAIAVFQHPLVALLGARSYTAVYGKKTFCGSNLHERQLDYTTSFVLFEQVGFYMDFCEWPTKYSLVRTVYLRAFNRQRTVVIALFRVYSIVFLDNRTISLFGEFWETLRLSRYVMAYGLSCILCGFLGSLP